ncbi:DUF4325 domain-containing protein [Pseudoalteromonas sp. BZK2]|uniref:STAS-like domain-containing protein n=1 Tax=Pseudoalteromonas sp. BZK2 TaxID=1904458 RepID=UPI00165473B5|nr:DUF4325 domain-containing protein [Pseudoalteromonas sp. BZK2]MBC7010432.1 DUF4325 domain-containing protein [Pseudoalteromonas sp. BZK2]
MDCNNTLANLSKQLKSSNHAVVIELQDGFSFKHQGVYNFERFINFFDWTIKDKRVLIDMTHCYGANYQALSLIVLYAWKLKSQRCTVTFKESEATQGASEMFRSLGGRGTFTVMMHEHLNFKGSNYKPLFALRNNTDFKKIIESAESYTDDFNVEFTKTLRYVLSELLYNTREHGQAHYQYGKKTCTLPSLCQFSWYKNKSEVSFIIADNGVGIKAHLEQAYPGQENHAEAILKAMKPKVSGTFGTNDPYRDKNNAGIGLFLSTNIIRRLNAEMHIISGDAVVHISPRDITSKKLNAFWPGTFVLVTIKVESGTAEHSLEEMLRGFREEALQEQNKADTNEQNEQLYVNISNYFGFFAEDKEAAISFKETKIFPALDSGKKILLDFKGIESSPHSFLSALLASPIKSVGMRAYKVFKIVNATADIRETVDFILDENTE